MGYRDVKFILVWGPSDRPIFAEVQFKTKKMNDVNKIDHKSYGWRRIIAGNEADPFIGLVMGLIDSPKVKVTSSHNPIWHETYQQILEEEMKRMRPSKREVMKRRSIKRKRIGKDSGSSFNILDHMPLVGLESEGSNDGDCDDTGTSTTGTCTSSTASRACENLIDALNE